LPQESGFAIRQRLLDALAAEGINTVRNKIGDAVAEIAREYADNSMSAIKNIKSFGDHSDKKTDQQWPELLGILFQLSQSADPGQRENAYRIFTTTPGIIEKQHEDTVLSAFTKGFKDDAVDVSSPPIAM